MPNISTSSTSRRTAFLLRIDATVTIVPSPLFSCSIFTNPATIPRAVHRILPASNRDGPLDFSKEEAPLLLPHVAD